MTTINKHETGFALLITLITIGAVLAITLSLIDLSLKQLDLAVDARDSEVAFQAANAGIECAQRVRRISSATLEVGNASSFQCFGLNPSVNAMVATGVTEVRSNQGNIYRYQTTLEWGSSPTRCSEIDMVVMVSDVDSAQGVGATGLSSLYTGFPNSKDCPPGSRCTIAVSRGYNTSCGNRSGQGVLRREILLEF